MTLPRAESRRVGRSCNAPPFNRGHDASATPRASRPTPAGRLDRGPEEKKETTMVTTRRAFLGLGTSMLAVGLGTEPRPAGSGLAHGPPASSSSTT